MCTQCGNPFHIGDATDGSVSSAAPTTHLNPAAAGAQITRHNYHWGSTLGSAAGPITFGFRSAPPAYNSTSDERGTFSAFSTQEMAAAEYAMQMWAHLANVSFSEVNPGGYTNSAIILFGNYSSTTDNSQAFAYFPSSNNQNFSSAQGDVWLNINYEHTTNLFAGSYDLYTIVHEIGHSLGLEHPGAYNAGPGQTITYGNSAQYVEDSRQYSVMSYFSASNTGANHVYNGQTIYASTPLLDDVVAIQRLYGANTSYAAGNTTYGFHSNADAAFQLTSSTQQAVFTIWDGGGNDTVDFSGYSTNQVLDLLPGTFSSVGALTFNISIALGTIIENVVSGSGNDVIYENSANNIINGGSGTDTLVFTGGHLQYQATLNQDGSLTLTDVRSGSPDGTDTAIGIENFQFSDGTYTSDQLVQPQSANDIIHGSSSSDVMSGGAGDDTYFVDNAGDQVIENAGEGTDTVVASINFTLSANVEVLALNASALNATGNSAGNFIYGNTLDNSLDGAGGADLMLGGVGNDTYFVEDRGDQVTENAAEGTDTVVSEINYTLGANVEVLALSRFAQIGTGNSLDNLLFGNDQDNLLDGFTGADDMLGRTGNDTYVVDNVGDRVIENLNEGTDEVVSSVNYVMGANVEKLQLVGSAVTANGNDGDNFIRGNGLDNIINGGSGNDILTGGAGRDTFVFRLDAGGQNAVTDLDLSANSDFLAFGTALYANSADVLAHSAQVGADVVIAHDAAHTITLQNTTLAAINAHSGDFQFI